MTALPITQAEAIRDAAIEAACASRDAHGCLVKATIAWDFLRTLWFESEDERYNALPDEEWPPADFVVRYYNA